MGEAASSAADVRAGSRRFHRAGAIGAVLAGLVFVAVLMNGHFTLLERDEVGGFYDVQAHSLLHGHWDVPAGSLGIEGFLVNGKTYEYYGPVPALLRLPIAAVTHHFDGRLTQLSMLLAEAVALLFTVRLAWATRRLARGDDDPVTTAECWLVGIFTFVVGAGSVLVFLASHAFVYHEAEIWGAALALAAFDRIIAFVAQPRGRTLAVASALATLAFLSRASVGAGPVLALGLLLVAMCMRWSRRVVGLPADEFDRRIVAGLAIAVLVPIALYAYVNYARFGTPFSLPLDKQLFSRFNAARRAALAANDNQLFGAKFVPTTLLQFVRLDGLRFSQLLPWVSFPSRATVVGNVHLDTIDNASSLPASMPLLVALSVVGVVGAWRSPRTDRPTLRTLAAPLAGALGCLAITLTFAFVANRYLSDAVPFLVIAGLAGLHLVIRWARSRAPRHGWTRTAVVVIVGLAAFSLWVNVGLAVLYQRMLSPSASQARSAAFLQTQYDVHDTVPGGALPDVQHGTQLPVNAPLGRVFVLGRCDAVYWSNGVSWRALARTPRGGEYRLRVTFPRGETGVVEPLMVTRTADGRTEAVVVQYRPHQRLRIGFIGNGFSPFGRDVRADPGRPRDLDIVLDPRTGDANVSLDGRNVLPLDSLVSLSGHRDTSQYLFLNGQVFLGRNPAPGNVRAAFSGRLRPRAPRPALCRTLANEG